MGRRSPQRKEELESKYGKGAFAPIAPKYMETARELSAKYILFSNRDNKHGLCEKCYKDVKFSHTKHNQKIVCPNCGETLQAKHTWRGKCKWEVDWYVVGEVVDSFTFALRYISVNRYDDYTKCINESARELYDFKHGWSYRFSWWGNTFHIDDSYCFQEFVMGGYRRKQCCIGAESIDNIKDKLRTLDAFKYFDKLDEYYGEYVYPRDNIKKLMSVTLYEKLEKAGMSYIAQRDFKNYWGGIKYKRTETELTKMLGINKAQFRLLKTNATIKNLDFIKANHDMSLNTLQYLVCQNLTDTYKWATEFEPSNPLKLVKYVEKHDIKTWDYRSHINMMEKLGYKIDENYRYPKDFYKEHRRVIDEYDAMLDEETIKGMNKQSKLIKKISDGLHKMPDLQEFLGDSKGLLVYVPESARDLITEGRLLHNCIGSYVDRIAQKKTLVFFVRRLNAPHDPFVAFEYCNGEVIQCRYDNNVAVKDDTEEGAKILSFVEAFAQKLRENNVLYKAA